MKFSNPDTPNKGDYAKKTGNKILNDLKNIYWSGVEIYAITCEAFMTGNIKHIMWAVKEHGQRKNDTPQVTIMFYKVCNGNGKLLLPDETIRKNKQTMGTIWINQRGLWNR